ncbi:MAG: L-histidine N(alpha)-methyltransferase [Pseudomonadota bacterium]
MGQVSKRKIKTVKQRLSKCRILNPTTIKQSQAAFGLDVLTGLMKKNKCIDSKYLYDSHGSKLYSQITRLPEYYLTKCEAEIIRTYRKQLAKMFNKNSFNLIELGPGEAKKSELLIKQLINDNCNFQYIPIDISADYIEKIVVKYEEKYPEISTLGLVADYFSGLNWVRENLKHKNIILFLGSTIGNYQSKELYQFLYQLWNQLQNGDLLFIGFDLRKDIELLINAYNDSKGITAEFNMNILTRINAELDGHFNKNKFAYHCVYNVRLGAIETFLVSKEPQIVAIDAIKKTFEFSAWEAIQTEYSHKFLLTDIEKIARKTGFAIKNNFLNEQGYFLNSLWMVMKH